VLQAIETGLEIEFGPIDNETVGIAVPARSSTSSQGRKDQSRRKPPPMSQCTPGNQIAGSAPAARASRSLYFVPNLGSEISRFHRSTAPGGIGDVGLERGVMERMTEQKETPLDPGFRAPRTVSQTPMKWGMADAGFEESMA